MTIHEFMKNCNISAEIEQASDNSNMVRDGWYEKANHWVVRFRRGNQFMLAYYSTGNGVKSFNASDVLDCLIMEAESVHQANGFEDWARDYGYDPDFLPVRQKAMFIYRNCQKIRRQLMKFLGAELYAELCEEVERL